MEKTLPFFKTVIIACSVHGFCTKLKTFQNEVFALGGQRMYVERKCLKVQFGGSHMEIRWLVVVLLLLIQQEQQCCTLLSGMRKNCFHVKIGILGVFYVTFLIQVRMLSSIHTLEIYGYILLVFSMLQ